MVGLGQLPCALSDGPLKVFGMAADLRLQPLPQVGQVFLLDGKYAWFYKPGDPHVQRIRAKELDDLRSPLRFLLGHTQLEKELSHLTVNPAANGGFLLTGPPKGQEKRFTKVSLTVTAEGAITAIAIEETDGAITRFTFSNEQPNAAIAPATFRWA